MRCAARCSSPGSAALSCSAWWRTWWTVRSPAARAKTWHASSGCRCSHASPGARPRTSGKRWREDWKAGRESSHAEGCTRNGPALKGSASPGPGFSLGIKGARVKFLCVDCDRQMLFEERQLPGDGTLAAAFRCPQCGRAVGLLTNPMETQLVASLGVKIGGTTIDPQPLETVRGMVTTGRDEAFAEAAGDGGRGTGVVWSVDAQERLARVPNFVRGMVKKIYADYAKDRCIAEITPAVMDTARSELGLEGM